MRHPSANAQRQCDRNSGTVIFSSIVRVTPPRISSHTRACPYAPMTSRSAPRSHSLDNKCSAGSIVDGMRTQSAATPWSVRKLATRTCECSAFSPRRHRSPTEISVVCEADASIGNASRTARAAFSPAVPRDHDVLANLDGRRRAGNTRTGPPVPRCVCASKRGELGDLLPPSGCARIEDRTAHLGQCFIQGIYSQHAHLDVAERRGRGRAAQERFGTIPRFTLEY